MIFSEFFYHSFPSYESLYKHGTKSMDKGFEIADIIVAFIKGDATPEQIVRLDEWQNESDENKRLFVSLLDETNFDLQVRVRKELNIEKAFNQVKSRKRTHDRRFKRVWQLSLVASIAVLVVVCSVMLYKGQEAGVKSEIDQGVISGGTNKALLTLSTGEQILLDKQDTLLQSDITRIRVASDKGVTYESIEGDSSIQLAYNTMEIPPRAEFQLVLSDGTKVWLNAGSKLRYPERFVGDERQVELSGEAYFDVVHDEKAPFIVKTSRSTITVLGTEFGVRDYEGKANLTTLVQGRVAVCDSMNKSYVIYPGQQVIIDERGTTVEDVETAYFTSWKDGYFTFNQATLGDIMDELSQWYDFDCFFTNATVTNLRLTARLKKYDDINVLLDILSDTGDVCFSRKGRAITVTEISR